MATSGHHLNIIHATELVIGRPSDEEGMCAGIGGIWRELFFSGKEQDFFAISVFFQKVIELSREVDKANQQFQDEKMQASEEVRLLSSFHHDLKSLIDYAKQKVATKQAVSELESRLAMMPKFLETIDVFQNIRLYEEKIGKYLTQFDDAEISSILAWDEVKSHGGIETIYSEPRLDTLEELQAYFNSLAEILGSEVAEGKISDAPKKISISVNGYEHHLDLHYDIMNKQWIVIEANNLPFKIVEREDIAKHIAEMFVKEIEKENFFALNFSITTTKSNPSPIRKKLMQFKKDNVAFCSSEKMKRINTQGLNLAMLVAAHNHLELLQEMQFKKADLSAKGVLFSAVNWNRVELLQELLKIRRLEILEDLKKEGKLVSEAEEVNKLIADYVNTKDAEGNSILYLAVSSASEAMVRLLLNNGADKNIQNTRGETLAHAAARNGRALLIPLLKELGLNFNARDNGGNTPLLIAAKSGHVAMVAKLFESGADINAANEKGWSAMHYAIRDGNEKLFKLLISQGAKFPEDIVQFALEKNRHDFVDLLIQAKANFNFVDELTRKSALMIAVETGYVAAVKHILAECKIDMSAQDISGWTVFHYAAQSDNPKLMALLLQNIENLSVFDIKDSHGKTFLDIALDMENKTIIEMIQHKQSGLSPRGQIIRLKTSDLLDHSSQIFVTDHKREKKEVSVEEQIKAAMSQPQWEAVVPLLLNIDFYSLSSGIQESLMKVRKEIAETTVELYKDKDDSFRRDFVDRMLSEDRINNAFNHIIMTPEGRFGRFQFSYSPKRYGDHIVTGKALIIIEGLGMGLKSISKKMSH